MKAVAKTAEVSSWRMVPSRKALRLFRTNAPQGPAMEGVLPDTDYTAIIRGVHLLRCRLARAFRPLELDTNHATHPSR
jgi:hypothetical protein